MDMEIDIPLPEELELLEAESHFYEEESFPDPPSPDPSPRAPPKSPASSSARINASKRYREVEELGPASEDIKKSKAEQDSTRVEVQIDDEKEEEEEEWLRYSPPPERDIGTAAEGVTREEVSLSRYVSNINGDCVPVTAPSGGDRVYAKICRVENEISSKKLDIRGQSKEIIAEPFNILLQKAEQRALTNALNASSESHDLLLAGTPASNEQLWVDKYAPSSFTELLSDEHTNREVLLWLKQWDSSVFGSEIRSTSDDVLSALRRHSTTQYQRSFDSKFSNSKGYRWKNGSHRKPANSGNGNDDLKGIQGLLDKKSRVTGPPEQKILLLCGPPGLGKTTLAHVAAQHCGYRVVEVNASDDRSSSTIEAKILDVVQMNSVMADSKPKCLVIDEIDGALGDGKGAVEVLLKMVSERKSNMGKENVGKEEKTRKISSKKSSSLSRPIICICNDLYAPVLRPLRQTAKVHVFVQPTISRIVSRLKYICNKEGMKTSSFALTSLAEYTECDIRSCLNTLQFLNKKQEALNVMEISSQAVGRKDISRSTFDVWKEIFQKRKSKRERESTSSRNSWSGDFDFLHSLIASRGDYDTILDGIYENLLQLQYHDPVMQKTVKSLNYLGVSDRIQRYIMQTQKMQLQVYHPSAAIALHHLVAQIQKPHIEWPKSYQRYRTMLLERTDTLRSWHHGISPYISRHLSINSFVEDFISPLLHILSPPSLRPVALHLLSENEKNNLTQLVNVMVSYSITYKNVKPDFLSSLGHEAMETSALSLVPPINEFVSYKNHRWDYHILPLPMKQILLHEVEKQKILQVSTIKSSDATEGSKKGMKDSVGEEARTAAKIANVGEEGKNRDLKNTSNMRNNGPHTTTSASISGYCRSSTATTGQAIPGDAGKHTNSFCFFDRFRKAGSKGSQNANVTGQKEATSERDIRPLIFKFNEGYTNAVKRPIRMREFII